MKLLDGLLASFLGFTINILPNELAKSSLSSQMYDKRSFQYDNLSSYAVLVCDVSRSDGDNKKGGLLLVGLGSLCLTLGRMTDHASIRDEYDNMDAHDRSNAPSHDVRTSNVNSVPEVENDL